MIRSLEAAAAAILILTATPHSVLARCTLRRFAELPVTVHAREPLVSARINGAPASFLLDSGAFYSLLTPRSVAAYDLRLESLPYGLRLTGIGGTNAAQITTVGRFTLAHETLRNVEFVVTSVATAPGVAGVVGQNILRLSDAEYDLADGVVRLWRATGCGRAPLLYWARTEPYSAIEIARTDARDPLIIGTAALDGKPVRVLFDTGSSTSMVALEAARRAGFKRNGGAHPAAYLYGIGARRVPVWLWTFPRFQIGGETVRNAPLRVAELKLPHIDMILGADFFLAHRIFVAVDQRKLYFTYDGGPVFAANAPNAPQSGRKR